MFVVIYMHAAVYIEQHVSATTCASSVFEPKLDVHTLPQRTHGFCPFQVYSSFRGGGGEAQLRREVAQSVATNAAANAFTSRV